MTKNAQTIADSMDRHVLYQKSVQNPESEIEFITKTFKKLKGRDAKSIREDFAGTALFAVEWCQQGPDYTAVAVDLDTETLEWGRENNVKPAGGNMESQVALINENVLDYDSESKRVDTACAFNFSYNILRRREELVTYFENVREGLVDDGVFFLDVLGGTEAYQEALDEPREVEGEDFEYIWEQAKFNPITHEMVCYIHFQFKDGSKMEKAFTYEWRLRTIPEIVESLYEAGFSKVRCYWDEFNAEQTQEDDEAYTDVDIESISDIGYKTLRLYQDGSLTFDVEKGDAVVNTDDYIEIDIDSKNEEGISNMRLYESGRVEFLEDEEEEEELDTTGEYIEVNEVENQDTFVSYIVAEK